MRIKTIIFTLICILSYAYCGAAPVMVNAKLDSATMLMGKRGNLRIEVVQDKGTKGEIPLFAKFNERGLLTLLNDTVELSKDMKIDTVEVGTGRIQVNYNVPIQVFDSGMYKLPAFDFVVGGDTARSRELTLTVLPVPGVTADTPIKPMSDVAEAEESSVFDNLPDWLYYYWWVILLALCLLGGGLWGWQRFKKEGSILPKKADLPPYEVAIRSLKALKAKKLWEMGHEKAYYTELTEILRKYLEARFGIRAMEMTSSEIMSQLADMNNYDIPRDKMRDILDMADFVKFAMVRPLPDDNTALYNNAVEFVESTRPQTVEEGGENNTEKNSHVADDSGVNVGRRGRNARRSGKSKIHAEDRMRVGDHRKSQSKGKIDLKNESKKGKEVTK